jgi:hypothetical protein
MAKKVVSKRMAALIAKKAELKAIMKDTRAAARAFGKADSALLKIEDKIFELQNKEDAKAGK